MGSELRYKVSTVQPGAWPEWVGWWTESEPPTQVCMGVLADVPSPSRSSPGWTRKDTAGYAAALQDRHQRGRGGWERTESGGLSDQLGEVQNCAILGDSGP